MKSNRAVCWLRSLGWLLMPLIVGFVAPPLLADENDGTETKPLEMPTEKKIPVKRAGSDGNEVWIKFKNGKAVGTHISLEQKSHKWNNDDNLAKRAVKIKKLTYKAAAADPGPPAIAVGDSVTINVSSTGGSVNDGNETSDVLMSELENATPAVDWSKPIKIEYDLMDSGGQAAGVAGEGVDVNVRIINGGAVLDAGAVGPDAKMWLAEGEPLVTSVATAELGLVAAGVATPDLIFYCIAPPRAGNIVFVPLGHFTFGSLPDEIFVFDSEGTDLVSTGALTLGEAYISLKGELVVPVTEVSATMADFAMIVRGVSVDFDGEGNSSYVQCYTVSGSSFEHLSFDAAPIGQGQTALNCWQGLSWSPTFTFGTTTVPVWDDLEETVVQKPVGVSTPTVVSGEDNSGYLSGLVIEGIEAGSITEGKVIIRPLGGMQFVEDENTKLYVVNAATGANVSVTVNASIEVNSLGAIEILLDDLGQSASLKLRLVVVNPKVGFNAPIAWGVGYDLNVYGSALGSAMKKNFTLLEGCNPEQPSLALPDEPRVEVCDWEEAAAME